MRGKSRQTSLDLLGIYYRTYHVLSLRWRDLELRRLLGLALVLGWSEVEMMMPMKRLTEASQMYYLDSRDHPRLS